MDRLGDRTLEDIAKAYPEALRVFQQYRIDPVCWGRLSLAEVARKLDLDLAWLLEDLENVAHVLK